MIFEYIHADASRELITLDEKPQVKNNWQYIKASSKLKFIKEFIPKFQHGQKMVLFDQNHKQLLDFYENNNINKFANIDNIKAKILFFTSGSSGFPIGAFKSEANLILEVLSLKKILHEREIQRVVVTVPFVHIYGILAGLLLPLSLENVTLIVKEDFLPYELLEEASIKDTLVITTPVFIKALAKLPKETSLVSTLFISSTAPLSLEDVEIFEEKYNSQVMQLFGSTETGGIAYKLGKTVKWTPIDGVKIEKNEDKLSLTSPFISEYILDTEIKPLIQPYTTEDIVAVDKGNFKLIGRSNKLIKIAGKRISALQIEQIVENITHVNRAIVELVYKKELLRSEQIVITLEASKKIDKKNVKEAIAKQYGVITIPFRLKYVDKINYSAMGKKVIFR